jgi:hypothetical protein
LSRTKLKLSPEYFPQLVRPAFTKPVGSSGEVGRDQGMGEIRKKVGGDGCIRGFTATHDEQIQARP